MEIRICTCCGISRPLEDFYRYSLPHDGYNRKCKQCESERRKARYRTPEGKAVADANTKRWMTVNRDRWNEMQARNARRRAAAKKAAKLMVPPPA